MTPHQEVSRAKEALQVLDNPTYKEAMQSMREQIVADWKACPIRDREGQMLYLQLAKLADKFESILKGYIEAGKMAQHKIDINRERDETVVRRWIRKVA